MMSVSVGQVRLREALRDLKLSWRRVSEEWDDQTARAFYDEYLAPLDTKVLSAMGAMSRLGEVMAACKRECE